MTFTLENGTVLRSDFIISFIIRNDLAPIPESLEAKIRADNDVIAALKDDSTIESSSGHIYRVIKSEVAKSTMSQGARQIGYISIIAILEDYHMLSFVRDNGRAVGKENASLSVCYRACGAAIRDISGDFSVPRFNCFVGDTPTFAIARILQESGGVVRIKNNKLSFISLREFNDLPVNKIASQSVSDAISSVLISQHEVPNFISINNDATLIKTTSKTARTVDFSPHKNSIMLGNMTRHLVLVQKSRLPLSLKICAGDVVSFDGLKKLIVMTAVHTFISGSDGQNQQSYTLLWLGEVRG